jgi:NADH-quinone oxidoreductase subunit E
MSERPSQLSQDVAHAMNLLAHPLGGLAAASAMGLGMATQAWGLWFGAVAGAMENAQRLAHEPAPAKADAETVAALKARAAAKNLMANAQSLAREMAETAPRKAAVAKPAQAAAKVTRSAAKPVPAAPAAGAAMAKPTALDKPARIDDLKAISGIGPKLEQVLNGMGIWSYAQIAGWTPAEVASVDDQLGFAGRILRDDWVGQAKKLGKEQRNG